jgi:hypothetical protein
MGDKRQLTKNRANFWVSAAFLCQSVAYWELSGVVASTNPMYPYGLYFETASVTEWTCSFS